MRVFLPTRALQYAGGLLTLCLLLPGCSMFSGGSKIHKSAQGSVHLREVADWSFVASHPAVIDQMTMLKAVKGLVADDVTKSSPTMPASGSKPMRVFSDEDAEFLAPLLAQALLQAKPEQIVGFTVSPSAGSGTEPTAGTLYVQQESLYLTIAPSKSKTVSGFIPSSAARIEKAPAYIAEWAAGTMSFAIDYQVLVKAPMIGTPPVAAASAIMPAAPAPAPAIAKTTIKQEPPTAVRAPATSIPAPSDVKSTEMSNDELLNKKMDELRQVRESNKMKDSEIAILKKEVEWMKHELRERTAEARATKTTKGSVPKKKTAEAYPTR